MSTPWNTAPASGGPPTSWWTPGLGLHERHDAVDRAMSNGAAEPGTDPRTTTGPELAAWLPVPEWARFVERAVADDTARTERPAVSSEDWVGAFAAPLRHLAEAAWRSAVDDVAQDGPADLAAIRVGWVDALSRQLATLAARTLVLELNLARTEGRLRGATPGDRFVDFVLRTDAPGGLRALLLGYPVLARLLGQTCQHAAAAHRELLDRFTADRGHLVDLLLGSRDPGPLVATDRGCGDPHQDGRTVTMLRFANGATVVYKPRSPDAHQHFGSLLRKLNEHTPRLRLHEPKLLVRPGYGWHEFIPVLPCADLAGVDQFYRRYGALLALVWTLGGTDIHCENIIACGDQPVIVDLETLFHPRLIADDEDDPAVHSLVASVYRTAMLPQFVAGKHGVLDLSGLGGDRDAILPVDCVDWADAGTDTMRLIRTARPFAGAHNRPRLDNEDVDPTQHQAAILDGFRIAHGALAAAAASAGGPADLLAPFASDPVRVLVRPTRIYAMLLDESTHPDLLRDGLDRETVFEQLWARSTGDPLRLRLVPHELRALWNGDVPAFFTRPDSGDLWAADGSMEPELLRTTGLDTALEMIGNSDEISVYGQEWLIQATIAARTVAVDHRGGEPSTDLVEVVSDPDTLLSSASGIGDEIVARACHRAGAANWLGLQAVDERYWAVLPMGSGLGDGYLGVALFLAQLGVLTDEDRYTAFAYATVRGVDRLLTRLSGERAAGGSRAIGGFYGIGGICYALARLSALLKDERLVGWTGRAVTLLRDSVDHSAQWDVGSGRAGALAAMVAVHQQLDLPEAGYLAEQLADELAAHLRTEPAWSGPTDDNAQPRGFLCGQAGIGWALTRHAAGRPDRARVELGHRLLAGESIGEEGGYGWCRGLSGVLLAALDVGLDRIPESLHPERLIAQPPTEDMSLCHGGLGVIEALTALARLGFPAASAEWQRRAGSLVASIEVAGPRCGTPGQVASPGLLTGLSGIGYGLLRLAFPPLVPSVLTLAV